MTPGHSWESFGPRQRRPEEEWALRLLPLLVCLSLPAFSLIFVKGPAGWRSEGGSSNVARGPFDRAAHNAMRAATAPRSLSPTPDPRHNLIPLRQERAPGRDSGSSWLRLHSNLWDVEIVMFYFCAGGRGGGVVTLWFSVWITTEPSTIALFFHSLLPTKLYTFQWNCKAEGSRLLNVFGLAAWT